ncbi:MAG: hypothetical protein ACOCW2_02975, partial [Chitinivibrionales bacterium]
MKNRQFFITKGAVLYGEDSIYIHKPVKIDNSDKETVLGKLRGLEPSGFANYQKSWKMNDPYDIYAVKKDDTLLI